MQINERWSVTADQHCFILTEKIESKNNTTYEKSSYFSSLPQIAREIARRELSDITNEVATIEELVSRFSEKICAIELEVEKKGKV